MKNDRNSSETVDTALYYIYIYIYNTGKNMTRMNVELTYYPRSIHE